MLTGSRAPDEREHASVLLKSAKITCLAPRDFRRVVTAGMSPCRGECAPHTMPGARYGHKAVVYTGFCGQTIVLSDGARSKGADARLRRNALSAGQGRESSVDSELCEGHTRARLTLCSSIWNNNKTSTVSTYLVTRTYTSIDCNIYCWRLIIK